ncbi:hypothetical protein TCAL_09261 [Tigriopus californicus]|uniref:F-box domain-containing protein n=1 Tax=Tigriopus californicus TaxID=6832 RepID=A0A553N6K6_TIGCA|nr:uncharacterized protein LOC131884549 [Tigriopus californicus]TRY61069.1 hypothetical protein TCAL_09261 [Tigriopus californicus]|eukprot:TCALIF_09261-PA protein Name:"Protein of unknown function" AED:0.85 eAED:1.00 QI:0/-1/0/1/-1/1/1/0/317
MASILDLPPEILEDIFQILHPNLIRLTELAQVCSLFRLVAYNIPIGLHIPVNESKFQFLSSRAIPITTLSNREPAMFVKEQILGLNIKRLISAQVVSNDYQANKLHLSPHYLQILNHLAKWSQSSLRHLFANLDLLRLNNDQFRCSAIVLSFQNLTFLSIAFNRHIELQQKVLNQTEGGNMIQEICAGLKKLKSLYIFSCPSSQLVIKSPTLEKLHIYKSEFVAFKCLETPSLRKFMFLSNMQEFFRSVRSSYLEEKSNLHDGLFGLIYDGCPKLDLFNKVDLRTLRKHDLSRDEWCAVVLRLCLRSCVQRQQQVVT